MVDGVIIIDHYSYNNYDFQDLLSIQGVLWFLLWEIYEGKPSTEPRVSVHCYHSDSHVCLLGVICNFGDMVCKLLRLLVVDQAQSCPPQERTGHVC